MRDSMRLVDINSVIVELRECPTWICWKKRDRNGGIAKIPINPIDGGLGDVTDSSKWTNISTAFQSCKKFGLDGIGFVFSKEYGYVGIDIDHCIDENGKLNSVAKEIISTLNSYTEISPSGQGIHIICKGHLPKGNMKNTKLGIEMYEEKRYFTFTGEVYKGYNQLGERVKELSIVYDKFFKDIKNDTFPMGTKKIKLLQKTELNEGEIISRASRSKNGNKFQDLYKGNWQSYYSSQSEADQAFCCMLAFWTGKDNIMMDAIFRKSGLYRKKWDDKHFAHGKTYGQVTITKAINSCSRIYQSKVWSEKEHLNHPVKNKIRENNITDKVPEWYEFSNGKVSFLPGILAKHLAESVPAIYVGDKFYLYKGGVYKYISAAEATKIVQDKLIDRYSKSSHVKDAFELWKNKIYKNISELNNEINDGIINFKNGLFDIYSREFKEHNPELLTTVQLNSNYNHDADCTNFSKFMGQMLPEDCVMLAQELLGYLLAPITSAQKAFVLYGPPRTGKSTFLRVIENIVDKENISNVAWQDLDSRFRTALLYGKIVNIFADLPNKPLEDGGIFKVLTGEDMLIAEQKFCAPFSFKNKARLLFSCNELPKNYGDRTDAFYRRLIILPFNHQVSVDKIDTKLSYKLSEEKDGIVQWALQGLFRLIDNDFRFTETETTKKLLNEYKIESDTVLWFVNNYCEVSTLNTISSKKLYDVYKNTCMDNGLKAVSQIKFNKTIECNYNGVITKSKEITTRRAMYKGIKTIF